MKKTIAILAALLAASAAVSCNLEIEPSHSDDEEIIQDNPENNEENNDPEDNGNTVPDGFKRVTVNAVQGKELKTAYENDVTFSWTSGDEISVYCTDASNPSNTGFYTFGTTEDGPSASFTADIPVTAEVGDVALFPASSSHSYEGGAYKFNVDADKSLVSHYSADIPMYGEKDGSGDFSFTHLAGAFKLIVTDIPAGISQVKVTFTAASSKMSGQFDVTGSGPYTWNTAAGENSAARTIIRKYGVSSNTFTMYLPYTTGTIWGDNTLQIRDFTGDADGSVLYSNDAMGAIPVTRKQVTRLGSVSCESGYSSYFGVDWSGISESVNAKTSDYPAIRSMKATMNADFFYILLNVNTDALTKTHSQDNYIRIMIGGSGSSGLWGAETYSQITANVGGSVKDTQAWAVIGGVPQFNLSSNREIQNHVSVSGNTAYYELAIPRTSATAVYSALASGPSPIKVGVVMDDMWHTDSPAQWSYDAGDPTETIGVIPTQGTEMYSVPQYSSSTLATLDSPVDQNFYESLTETVNPERGMYRHNEYFFREGSVNKTSVSCESDKSLVLTIFYLDDFMATEHLSSFAVTSIRTVLSNVRSAGKKAIVRFAYNNEHNRKVGVDPVTGKDIYEDINPREPETLSYITNHIEDLEDVFEDYKDIIYLVQAGFLGTYGEWYYTTSESSNPLLFPMPLEVSGSSVTNFTNRATVLAKILDIVPNTIQVALRTPFYKRFYLSPDSVDSWSDITSWDGTDANSRLALHNDAFLASENDMGTFKYSPDKPMWKAQSAKLAIGGEVAFIKLASADPEYYSLEPALTAIGEYHYSYLNDASSNDEIIQYWVARDEYPIIRKALGYRLVLNNLQITPATDLRSGSSVNFKIKISNTGSASVIYPRPCKLVLIHESTPTVLKDMTAAYDVRSITPGSYHTYDFDVTLPQNICEGDRLAIWMPDKTAGLQSTASYSIRLSNNGVSWENGYNVIFTF